MSSIICPYLLQFQLRDLTVFTTWSESPSKKIFRRLESRERNSYSTRELRVVISTRAAGRTTRVSLMTTRVELSKKHGIATFLSEPLRSPVNPHDVVNRGY